MTRTGTRAGAGRDRGQLVLLAAVTLALALVPLALAYLQLGYAGDVAREPAVETAGPAGFPGGADAAVLEAVDRTATIRIGDVAGAYGWSDRRAAVSAYHDGLEGDLDAVEGATIRDGTVIAVTAAPSVAAARSAASCPAGPNRVFGGCEADRGVVVQDRAGTTTVVAVALKVDIRRASGTTTATVVVVP
ncbi:DUF7261 family protein [Halopenitus persicus]|uniref:DUF7261 family protein n=1 Tax=Halopenitus persicus TaxID=1048396 RepID=UPI0012FD10DC|nr:hypothetical protein [Halopenitus persicus]